MKTELAQLRKLSLILCAGFALQGASAAPGSRGAMSEGQAQYQQDRAACISGQTNQDRATCMKEAAAALAEARRGGLSDGDGQLRRNSRDRCNALAGDERSDCMARMRGEGTVSGSVGGGGIIREKRTIETLPSGSRPASGTMK
ncbi:MAG: hypothetical protein ABI809_05625 [Caldimonas sp.]